MANNGSIAANLEAMLPRETLDAVADVAGAASETAGLMAGNVRQIATRFGKAARQSVRERPARAILGAVAVGFVLGVLWKS